MAASPALAARSAYQRRVHRPPDFSPSRPPGPWASPPKQPVSTSSRQNLLPADPSPSSELFNIQRRTKCYAPFSRRSSWCLPSEQRLTQPTAATAGLAVKTQCPVATNKDDGACSLVGRALRRREMAQRRHSQPSTPLGESHQGDFLAARRSSAPPDEDCGKDHYASPVARRSTSCCSKAARAEPPDIKTLPPSPA